jgi:hypothetical protein
MRSTFSVLRCAVAALVLHGCRDAQTPAPAFPPAEPASPSEGIAADAPPERPAAETAARKAETSMHIGNSLTDTIDGYLDKVASSGGIALDAHLNTIPGAGTRDLWNDHHAEWAPDLQGRRYDHLTLQPFPNMPCHPDGKGGDADFVNRFYEAAKRGNPNVQLWIYHQWPRPTAFTTPNVSDRGDCISGGGWLADGWIPPNRSPKTWEEGLRNQLSYDERVRKAVMDLNPGGRNVYVIPGGLSLLNLKKEVEAGRVPGMAPSGFFPAFFGENGNDVHLLKSGRWFISLVFYACMFQKDPSRLAYAESGLTAVQAKKLGEVVWNTVRQYPLSGVPR